MGWNHPRRLTVRIPSTQRFEPELSITFEVEEAGSAGFSALIEEYVNFCVSKGATGKVIKDVIDGETGEPCLLMIDIIGSRQACGMEMQRIGPMLMQHSKRVA
jgi:hypothetical protein